MCAFSLDAKCQSITNIYEHGEPLSSCDANFKNLFKNWSNHNIMNADDYSLINYSFVETISDTSAIELYSQLLTDNKSLIGTAKNMSSSGGFMNGDNYSIHKQIFNVRTFGSLCDSTNMTSADIVRMKEAFEQERKNMKYAFKYLVNVGDKVYVIFFKDKYQIYSSFIICSAKTKKVIWDTVFSNIKIKQ